MLPYRQYNVVVDGSRRVTLRNRKFLRRIDPVTRKDTRLPEIDAIEPSGDQSDQGGSMAPSEPVEPPVNGLHDSQNETVVPCSPPSQFPPEVLQQPLRRSTRVKKQAPKFMARMHGKTHGEE